MHEIVDEWDQPNFLLESVSCAGVQHLESDFGTLGYPANQQPLLGRLLVVQAEQDIARYIVLEHLDNRSEI